MKNKGRLPHIMTVTAFVFFIILGLSCGTMQGVSQAITTEETTASIETTSQGIVYDMPPPAGKPFDTLGVVFATSVTKFDENGLEISSEEGVIIMLLREAQKLGGNDIYNLRIDEQVVFEQTTTGSRTITTKKVTNAGSALAIRYRNN
jgi:hypothetical protein